MRTYPGRLAIESTTTILTLFGLAPAPLLCSFSTASVFRTISSCVSGKASGISRYETPLYLSQMNFLQGRPKSACASTARDGWRDSQGLLNGNVGGAV